MTVDPETRINGQGRPAKPAAVDELRVVAQRASAPNMPGEQTGTKAGCRRVFAAPVPRSVRTQNRFTAAALTMMTPRFSEWCTPKIAAHPQPRPVVPLQRAVNTRLRQWCRSQIALMFSSAAPDQAGPRPTKPQFLDRRHCRGTKTNCPMFIPLGLAAPRKKLTCQCPSPLRPRKAQALSPIVAINRGS